MSRNTIIIIEDNEMNLELATDILEATGFEVHGIPSAEAAIRQLPELNPDLIIMDIALPGIDGLSAIRLLKQCPPIAHVPIVVVSAHAMRSDADAAIVAGCAGYMTKPIDTRTFSRDIAGYLDKSRLARKAA